MFVTIIQNVRQYWCSVEKNNAGVSLLDTVSSFFSSIANNDMQFGFAVKDTCGFKG